MSTRLQPLSRIPRSSLYGRDICGLRHILVISHAHHSSSFRTWVTVWPSSSCYSSALRWALVLELPAHTAAASQPGLQSRLQSRTSWVPSRWHIGLKARRGVALWTLEIISFQWLYRIVRWAWRHLQWSGQLIQIHAYPRKFALLLSGPQSLPLAHTIFSVTVGADRVLPTFACAFTG